MFSINHKTATTITSITTLILACVSGCGDNVLEPSIDISVQDIEKLDFLNARDLLPKPERAPNAPLGICNIDWTLTKHDGHPMITWHRCLDKSTSEVCVTQSGTEIVTESDRQSCLECFKMFFGDDPSKAESACKDL